MSTREVKVPEIGGAETVGVIDVLVKPGEKVSAEASLVTLESDKATMDVPSPAAGTVKGIAVKVGDRVGEGSLILSLEEEEAAAPAKPDGQVPARGAEKGAPAEGAPAKAEPSAPAAEAPPPALGEDPGSPAPVRGAPAGAASGSAVAQLPAASLEEPSAPPLTSPPVAGAKPARVHASPSVRKLARELGVELALVTGTGPRSRIRADDVRRFVKDVMTGAVSVQAGGAARGGGGGLDLLPWPRIDFSLFGQVEAKPLSRIKKISGANLSRNWVMIPHVTQHDEADITELEAFRQRLNAEAGSGGAKVTLLAFLVKACVAALRKFPEVNASLDGESLVLKRYFHLGFAADTPNGLVVPVIKNANTKGILEIAEESSALAKRAREGKLAAADMQGGSFSISSLGGIGGTFFTPIINAPELAILGVSRSVMKPLWDGEKFTPRLSLPLSLSYDHRVIDGATAARFTTYLGQVLADMRRLML